MRRRTRRFVRTALPEPEDLAETAEELEAIQEQMIDLIQTAGRLLRGSVGVNHIIYRRAEGYWLAAISSGLQRREGQYNTTMEDTINELYAEAEGEEEY